jgi:hypothetical protein
VIVLNIGGEGEFPGAINVNSFVALRRPLTEIVRRGLVVGGDFTLLPIRSECVDAVIGNHLPLLGDLALTAMREVFRVLRRAGTIHAHSSAGGGAVLLHPMSAAGFDEVTLLGNYAVGRKL